MVKSPIENCYSTFAQPPRTLLQQTTVTAAVKNIDPDEVIDRASAVSSYKLSQNSHDRLSSLVIPTERGPAMSENPPQQKPLPTIWRVPDELWEIIEPILQEHDPPKNTGRPRVDQRAALDAIIFRMRSGVQWNRLPKGEFPDDSSVHRTFQRWVELGVLDLIWAQMIAECEELGGVNFEWQAADGAMGKARFGGTR